jgi:hypothetical protein
MVGKNPTKSRFGIDVSTLACHKHAGRRVTNRPKPDQTGKEGTSNLKKSTRVSFFVPESSRQRLDKIKEKMEWEKDGEAFRSGIRLLEDYLDLLESGATLIKRDADNTETPYIPLIAAGGS